MTDYDDWHEYGEIDRPTPAEDKADEIAWETARDAHLAAEEAAAKAVEPDGDDPDECRAEFIDGSWTYCGCDDCNDREQRDHDDYEGEHGEGTWLG